MTGRPSKASSTTEAPMMPVVAASSTPISVMVTAMPPPTRPNSRAKLVINRFAMPDRVQHQAHEHEHGQGDHHPVLHDIPDALDADGRIRPVDTGGDAEVDLEDDRQRSEQDGESGEDPSDRKPGEHQPDEGQEHHEGEYFVGRHGGR